MNPITIQLIDSSNENPFRQLFWHHAPLVGDWIKLEQDGVFEVESREWSDGNAGTLESSTELNLVLRVKKVTDAG